MKIRTDFVTNSSASSFILARTAEINERQKSEIIDFVERKMLGKELLSPNSTEEEIQKAFQEVYGFEDKKAQDQAKEILKSGKSIYTGWVYYEDSDNQIADMYQSIWRILEKYGDGNFVALDDDLAY